MMSLYLLLSMTYWDNVKQQWEHMLFDIDRRKTGESKALSTSVQKVPISSSETHSNSGRVTFENNEPIHCSSQPSPSVSSSPQEKSARNNGVGGNNTSDSNSDSDDEVSNSSL
ncbi:predicted protein [Chaetoceros tenuissimus]|uniref:Uncharacterized protein n=1 Tax=Chaetoceros tenuissimus TaxID=426638 RepID=A0AAD3CQT0_9STRA|nr:predicted protein [Chaetoceros tenuissimus]